MNFFISGHYRRSGEIVFDDVESIFLDSSAEFGNLTNLFNGNKFLERTGNAILNKNSKLFSRPAIQKTMDAATSVIRIILNEIFANYSKSEFESFFPATSETTIENDESDIKNELSLFSSNNLKSSSNKEIANLTKQIDLMHNFMISTAFVIIILMMISVFNCLMFKKIFTKFSSDENNIKSDPTSIKLI